MVVPGLFVCSYGTLTPSRSIWGLRALDAFAPPHPTGRLSGAAVDEAIDRMKDADPQVRWNAVLSLGRLAPASRAALPPLLAAMDDVDPDVRRAAAQTVARIGPGSPLFGWTMAAALAIPVSDKLWLTGLPSYGFALVALVALYWIGRWWSSEGTGLMACLLVGLNEFFLDQVRSGGPTTCVFAWSMLTILCHLGLRRRGERGWGWIAAGSVSFGGMVLCSGLDALWTALLLLLHATSARGQADGEPRRAAPITGTAILIGVGTALALPGLWVSGWFGLPLSSWSGISGVLGESTVSLRSLLRSMPTTFILALYGMGWAVRDVWKGAGEGDRLLPVLWVLVSLLAIRWSEPTTVLLLFLIAPLTLLAVRTLIGIAQQQLHNGATMGLATTTAALFVLSQSEPVRRLPSRLASGEPLTFAEKYWLHQAIDVALLAGVAVALLYRLASRHDEHRRIFLSGFIVAVLLLAWVPGLGRFDWIPWRMDVWTRLADRLAESGADPDTVIFAGTPPPPLAFCARTLYSQAQRQFVLDIPALERGAGVVSPRTTVFVVDPPEGSPPTLSLIRDDQKITLWKIFEEPAVAAYSPVRPTTER